MNNHSDKPSLPSIKDLLEGGPGLIDYSHYQNQQEECEEHPNKYKSHLSRHRRHVSEHITTTTTITLPQLSVPESCIHDNHNETLPIKMQSLSLEEDKPTSNRIRTHSRSYSDFTHPYPRSLVPTTTNSIITTTPTNNSSSNSSSVATIDNGTTIETKEETPLHQQQQDNKYICPYCNKGFTRPSSLRTHIYSHTGEKPFICTEPCCGRQFSVQSNLRRHLRVHRLSKPSPFVFTQKY